ncbi:uncharacterized protein MONOS_7805 [Monocercomonoides exilis]|uniref:uncharacterized protein n=1 Tax=Monocercomonoides exilis TaxID=2049356 RepID=UPI0035594FA2|nr:hypothetical protein MONOS_7805 [Monocercomonoides exilis]|eukprot:MONOS_7805.1-p1 / transcript=MONOS_7805.1 / gene=MONOS_7805 / organism=Monocercomonoides_exilis_PA203 / gene_product=unspecified product / transcript_product=unspecified product / location=Mono_scaffold00277:9212-11537(+) / protein_length=525 / sequence_SO=supercontig / SO=protein_coding / is_pseudo=false
MSSSIKSSGTSEHMISKREIKICELVLSSSEAEEILLTLKSLKEISEMDISSRELMMKSEIPSLLSTLTLKDNPKEMIVMASDLLLQISTQDSEEISSSTLQHHLISLCNVADVSIQEKATNVLVSAVRGIKQIVLSKQCDELCLVILSNTKFFAKMPSLLLRKEKEQQQEELCAACLGIVGEMKKNAKWWKEGSKNKNIQKILNTIGKIKKSLEKKTKKSGKKDEKKEGEKENSSESEALSKIEELVTLLGKEKKGKKGKKGKKSKKDESSSEEDDESSTDEPEESESSSSESSSSSSSSEEEKEESEESDEGDKKMKRSKKDPKVAGKIKKVLKPAKMKFKMQLTTAFTRKKKGKSIFLRESINSGSNESILINCPIKKGIWQCKLKAVNCNNGFWFGVYAEKAPCLPGTASSIGITRYGISFFSQGSIYSQGISSSTSMRASTGDEVVCEVEYTKKEMIVSYYLNGKQGDKIVRGSKVPMLFGVSVWMVGEVVEFCWVRQVSKSSRSKKVATSDVSFNLTI